MEAMSTGKGGRRKKNVDLNLVPFIDLMSVCIIFLLITAVWTQISMIQLGSSIYSNKTSDKPLDPLPFSEIILRVDILPVGFRISAGLEQYMIQKEEGKYNQDNLIEQLQKIKEKYPKKVDAIVSIRDDLPYKYLIEVMDSYLTAGFPNISIATGAIQ